VLAVVINLLNTLITIVAGVAGAFVLYWILNKVVELLPGKWEDRLKPYAFVLPALLVIALYLIYPAIQTINYSFANAQSTAYVGFRNYGDLLSSPDFRQTLLNTLLWIIIVPVVTIILGLGVATLADRLGARGEKLTKTIIFLPMAISAVGAGTIWKFIYAANPKSQPQIGLQNAIVTKFGADPINWLQLSNFKVNSLLLMVILLWGQVGFAMVLLSAAIKSVPVDTLEAARIDGANEREVFTRVIVPQIWPTVITVFITVTIGVMKIFDIVYVMTDGNFNTNVVGVDFYNQLFNYNNAGYAAAIVVMLMIAVIPIMYYQVRHFRQEEAAR
jgi:alpha-glucoside transport system permease protein